MKAKDFFPDYDPSVPSETWAEYFARMERKRAAARERRIALEAEEREMREVIDHYLWYEHMRRWRQERSLRLPRPRSARVGRAHGRARRSTRRTRSKSRGAPGRSSDPEPGSRRPGHARLPHGGVS
jgi:hypothetical protein